MIANVAEVGAAKPGAGAFARFADQWIYVFMAALFVVTALLGFMPTSIDKLAAVEAGQRPPLPLILHAHAVLMGSWLTLFLAQATLMATGRREHHWKLGLVGVVLAPAIVLAMIGVTRSGWSLVASFSPDLVPPDVLDLRKFRVSNILLEQIRMIVLFPALVSWALLVRRSDPEAHKRLMILATVLPLPAAIDRMTWLLPMSLPESPSSVHLYTLLWLLPVLIYDVARRGSVHRAYLIGIALNLPFIIASHSLWGSSWWLEVAPRLMGVEGW
jgi:hypothetical protein